jgi:hypothetical protein
MEALKIVLCCVLAAVTYGICHDQVTARICVEYFTIGHPPIFSGTQDPTILAFGWGVLATWWVGLLLGLPLAVVARVGSRPKLAMRQMVRPIAVLMAIVATSSLIAGVTGYFTAQAGSVWLTDPMAKRVPQDRHVLFLADLWAHSAGYGVGFFGGLVTCGWAWWSRGRDERERFSAELQRLRRENQELTSHKPV